MIAILTPIEFAIYLYHLCCDCRRFQEIAGGLDAALMMAALIPTPTSDTDNKGSRHMTLIKQSAALLDSLRGCWREDVFVISCSDKFLRLSLQLLSRYVVKLN